MLYRPEPLDFARQILVFVHIPKTAGSALDDALQECFGAERCLLTRLEKVGKIHSSGLHRAVWTARKFLRDSAMRLRGVDPLLPEGFDTTRLNSLFLLDGHFTLGAEPKTGREAVYITLVRDPVDRFLSDYYYRSDLRAEWPEGKRERRAFWTYDVDRFVDYVYERRSWTETNLQCRYLGGAGNFDAAKEAIDSRVFLAAPSNRIDDCLELLRPVLNLKTTRAARVNTGRARREKASPATETLAKIRAMVSQDQLLFDYVSRAFDDLGRTMSRDRFVS